MNFDTKARNRRIGRGLYYLFIAELLSFLSIVNILGWLVAAAGALISIYALYTMMKADPQYRTPFILTGLNLAFALFYSYCSLTGMTGTPVTVLQCVLYALNMALVYFVCRLTGALLEGIDASLTERASQVWKLYLFNDLLAIARTLLADAPETLFTEAWMDVAAVGVAVAAGLLYLFFLWQSQKTLQK